MKSVRDWFKKKKPEEKPAPQQDLSLKGAKDTIRKRNMKRKEILDQL